MPFILNNFVVRITWNISAFCKLKHEILKNNAKPTRNNIDISSITFELN
jgi:hypothetical protein